MFKKLALAAAIAVLPGFAMPAHADLIGDLPTEYGKPTSGDFMVTPPTPACNDVNAMYEWLETRLFEQREDCGWIKSTVVIPDATVYYMGTYDQGTDPEKRVTNPGFVIHVYKVKDANAEIIILHLEMDPSFVPGEDA